MCSDAIPVEILHTLARAGLVHVDDSNQPTHFRLPARVRNFVCTVGPISSPEVGEHFACYVANEAEAVVARFENGEREAIRYLHHLERNLLRVAALHARDGIVKAELALRALIA